VIRWRSVCRVSCLVSNIAHSYGWRQRRHVRSSQLAEIVSAVSRVGTAPMPQSEVKRALTETTLPFLSSVFFHDRDISVGLIGNHLPASHKARQNRSFGSTLCRKHEAMTLLGLGPAPSSFLHFPSGVKIGQRRPARYTTQAIAKAGRSPRLHQTTILGMRTR
jgi:hypothetical protein